MPDVTEVTAGMPSNVSGYVFTAPVGTTLPTTASESLNFAFKDMGFISADGVTETANMESNVIKDWGGSTILALTSSRDCEYKIKFASAYNTYLLKAVFGDSNVTGSLANGLAVSVNAADLTPNSYVIEMIGSGGELIRHVLPNAVPTAIGDITYVKNDAVYFDVTLHCMTDSSGNSAYKYIKSSS